MWLWLLTIIVQIILVCCSALIVLTIINTIRTSATAFISGPVIAQCLFWGGVTTLVLCGIGLGVGAPLKALLAAEGIFTIAVFSLFFPSFGRQNRREKSSR